MTRFFFTIDPGKRCCGWALWAAFDGGEYRLIACGTTYTDTPNRAWRIRDHLHQLQSYLQMYSTDSLQDIKRHCECMEVRGKFSQVNEADLLEVQLVAGALGTHFYTAQEWKGSITRSEEEERTTMKLSPYERSLLEAVRGTKDAPAHNAWSAVGLGCHVLKRLLNVHAEEQWRQSGGTDGPVTLARRRKSDPATRARAAATKGRKRG